MRQGCQKHSPQQEAVKGTYRNGDTHRSHSRDWGSVRLIFGPLDNPHGKGSVSFRRHPDQVGIATLVFEQHLGRSHRRPREIARQGFIRRTQLPSVSDATRLLQFREENRMSGHPSQGRCPAGGSHDASQSGHYAIPLEDGVQNLGQNSWRWCHKREGFFFAGHPSIAGVVPVDHQPSRLGIKNDEVALGALRPSPRVIVSDPNPLPPRLHRRCVRVLELEPVQRESTCPRLHACTLEGARAAC